MPQVSLYKNFNVEDVEFTVPEKYRGKYISFSTICQGDNKAPVYLQTPVLSISKIDNNQLFLDLADTPMLDIIKDLEEYTKKYILSRSESFFNGKRFSEEKIESSFVSTLEGTILSVLVAGSTLRIKDQRDSVVSFSELEPSQEVVAILSINGLSFSSSSITLDICVHQVKVYRDDNLDDWLITDEEKPVVVRKEDPSEDEVNFLLNHPIFDEDNRTVIAEEDIGHLDDLQNDDDLPLF